MAFLLRGIGDVSRQCGGGLGWLSWLSPIGWAHQFRPFAGERWWVLGLAVGAVLVLVAVAVALSARRDVGGGLFRPRPARPALPVSTPGFVARAAFQRDEWYEGKCGGERVRRRALEMVAAP